MLRLLARALRASLLAVGALVLIAASASFVRPLQASFSWPQDGGKLVVSEGTIDLLLISKLPRGDDPSNRTNRAILRRTELQRRETGEDASRWPGMDRTYAPYFTFIRIPLWLLAAICLAWPVTSFIIARRRRKGRGFAVEPAADAAPPALSYIPPLSCP